MSDNKMIITAIKTQHTSHTVFNSVEYVHSVHTRMTYACTQDIA